MKLGLWGIHMSHHVNFQLRLALVLNAVRPRDTRPQAARTSQVNVSELGSKKFEMNEFM